jgi:four helix bundle protein
MMTNVAAALVSLAMQDFRKLRVWHDSRRLTVAIYKLVQKFPAYEQFGLCSQLRRAVSSIGANIAEGFGLGSRANTARCLQTSLSEAGETYHHLITALDLGYLTQAEFDEAEMQLEPLRGGIAALFFKVKPRRKSQGTNESAPSGAASPRR